MSRFEPPSCFHQLRQSRIHKKSADVSTFPMELKALQIPRLLKRIQLPFGNLQIYVLIRKKFLVCLCRYALCSLLQEITTDTSPFICHIACKVVGSLIKLAVSCLRCSKFVSAFVSILHLQSVIIQNSRHCSLFKGLPQAESHHGPLRQLLRTTAG